MKRYKVLKNRNNRNDTLDIVLKVFRTKKNAIKYAKHIAINDNKNIISVYLCKYLNKNNLQNNCYYKNKSIWNSIINEV